MFSINYVVMTSESLKLLPLCLLYISGEGVGFSPRRPRVDPAE